MARGERSLKAVFAWLLPTALVMVVFLGLVFLGFDKFEVRHREIELQKFKEQAIRILDKFKLYANAEMIWCTTFRTHLEESKGSGQFIQKLGELRKSTHQKFEAVVWDQDGTVVLNEHLIWARSSEKELCELGRLLFEFRLRNKNQIWKKSPALKKFLGSQIVMNKLWSSIKFGNSEFVRPDSSGKFPDFWIGSKDGFLAMVFFERNDFDEDSGLKLFVEAFNGKSHRIAYFKNRESEKLSMNEKVFASYLNQLERDGKVADLFMSHMFAAKRIAGNNIILVYRKYSENIRATKATLLLVVVSLLLLIVFLRGQNQEVRLRHYSVKWQLLFMLLITTGLPLFALALLGSDHIARKRATLIESAYQECIAFLQHVEQRSKVSDAAIINNADKSIKSFNKSLPQQFGSIEIVRKIEKALGDNLFEIRLVSSFPALLMTKSEVFDGKRSRIFAPESQTQSASDVELKIFKNIASYYLNVVNDFPVDEDGYAETELLAEMAYQRPFHEIIQGLMLANNRIVPMGWGEQPYPVLVKIIGLPGSALADYFFAIILDKSNLKINFLFKFEDSLQRNPSGIRFLFANEKFYSRKRILLKDDPWLSEIYWTTGPHPSLEPCFTTIDGKPFIYASMQSRSFENFNLFAFYSLEKIEAEIAKERGFIISAGLIGLLMLVGLGLAFSSSFILPLSSLQMGAIAIRERDFSFRLNDLGNDEFGEMAKVFNSSIADFEELSLAGIVQARLLPQKGLSRPDFDLFGRSVPMAELGGDYFDYFEVDAGHYAILAGDVAGHGVGASLIMAMAKAGMILCRDRMSDPAGVLSELHHMIIETRTKAQRKIMTFQYLYYNEETGKALYSNAGGCSPILVDPDRNTAVEVTLSAPVLGGFKKSKFSNMEIEIARNQALVFYTDGIIEARNPAGEEIGYQRFKQMLLNSYDKNATLFHERIYDAYQGWLDGEPAQDDLTIIVLVRI